MSDDPTPDPSATSHPDPPATSHPDPSATSPPDPSATSHPDPPGLPLAPLRTFLDQAAPGLLQGPLRASLIAGGKSNLTYVVEDARRHTVIVRRPPLGHVLATAHDMVREHRVISALANTAVPVPATYAVSPGDEVIGAPFYVMERVEGTPYRHATELEAIGAGRTTAIAERMIDTLVALHHVDPESVGLGDFGRPDGFLERQVRRWKKQLDQSRSRPIEGIDELHDKLAASIPTESAPAIVHGDFRLDNLLVDAADDVSAVLDWEMATLGDPLTDIGLLAAYQGVSLIAGGDVVSDVAKATGYPSVDDLLARYAAESGRDLSSISFHLGLAHFKLAVILEGIHYRYVHGQTVGEGFAAIGDFIVPLVRAGLHAIEEN